jgi:hypothetical protein
VRENRVGTILSFENEENDTRDTANDTLADKAPPYALGRRNARTMQYQNSAMPNWLYFFSCEMSHSFVFTTATIQTACYEVVLFVRTVGLCFFKKYFYEESQFQPFALQK